MSGVKRASPGAHIEKDSLQNAELSDADAQKLQEVQKDIARVELVLERRAQKELTPVYAKRRSVAKSIPRYWPIALMNHNILSFHAQHNADRQALSYLEDVWIERDPKESRCYTIELHFKTNPYFADTVLKKEYKYLPPPAAADEKPDADGIIPSMFDFSWERDVEPSSMKIQWKDPENALTKLHPRVEDEDGDDIPADAGSFFNFFEIASDPFDIANVIANEVFPEATDYFLGNMGGDEIDSDEEDSEDDDDDAEEIDLEKPRAKKQKKN